MASLTNTLNSASSSRRIIDPQNNKGPTFLEGLANIASNLVDGGAGMYRQLDTQRRQTAAAQRQASTDMAENDAARFAINLRRGAFNPTAPQPSPVEGLPNIVPFDAELEGAPNLPGLDQSVSEIQRSVTAEEQGRLPAGSSRVMTEAALSDLLARHPDQQNTIMKVFKDAGIDHALFRDWESEQKGLDAVRDAELAGFTANFNAGVQAGLNVPGADPLQVAAAGQQILRAEQDLKMAKAQQEARQAATDEARAATTFEQKELDRTGTTSYLSIFEATATPLYNAIASRITEAGAVDDMGNVRSLEQLLPESLQGIDQITNNLISRAIADGMSTEVQGAIRQRGEALKTSLTQMWSGDGSQFKVKQQALSTMQTSLGLRTAEALPVYTAMSEIFGEAAISELFAGALPAPVMEALKKEVQGIQGMIDTPGEDLSMANLAGLLRGQLDINTITERQAVQAIPTLAVTHERNANSVVQGSGNTRAYLNSGIQLANAALELQPGADYQRFRQVSVAQNYLFQNSQLQADIKMARDNPADGELMIRGKRAAATHTLRLAQNQRLSNTETSMGWRMNFVNGQYVAQLDRAAYDRWGTSQAGMAARMPVERGLGAGRATAAYIPYDQARGRVPQVLRDQAWGMNLALNYLVETASFDDDFSGASKSEVRQFFATQGAEIPRSMEQRQRQDVQRAETYQRRDAETRRAIQGAVQGSMEDAQESLQQRPRSEAVNVGRNVLSQRGWSPAAIAGILGNLQAESGFNTTIQGDGGKAKGLAQWHPDRRAEAARQGFDLTNINDAYAFIDWELNNTERAAGDRLRNARTAQEAADIFALHFLRPRGAQTGDANQVHNINGRRQNANRFAREG